MSRRIPRDAALSAPAPHRCGARAGGVRRLRLAAAGASAALAAGLLIGWNPPHSAAQQSPDAWSGDRRAVLPSGLAVQLDFSAAPGVAVTAEPGELADRAGGGRAAALYTDGVRPGDPAQAFRIAEDRPQTDGSWRTVGTLQIGFSRAVRNPRLHLSGLAGIVAGKGGAIGTATRLTLTGGSPAAPTLVNRTDFPGWTVDGNTLAPAGADGGADPSNGSAAEGSLELAGTFRTAVFRVEQRSTARDGSTAAPQPLVLAATVTLDEGVGTAPQGYGNASHLLSDLFLGADATTPARFARRPATTARGQADEPLVQLDHGAARRSVWANPAPPQLQPGRGEYQGADPAVSYPTEAAIGHYYRLVVPVAVSGASATLAGWVDFDHSGRFDPAERVQAEIPAGADTAALEWTVPAGAASGETWARLRIGRDATQLVPPGGFADSGEVSDQRIRLNVGAARPEIAIPVDGSVVSDARPQVRGEGAVAGATVEVRDGDAVLCKARVERGGDWSCRPGSPLGAGAHSLTPVETTTGGVVLRGEPVRITVKTAPPAAPVLSLPEYTNDPGLQLTGTGEPGSTVSVADQPAGGRDGAAAELCSTAVRSDGGWACLPVENLADGRHQLTPTAVDAAGNRSPGRSAALVVDTVPPDRPVLTAPVAGETVRAARPKFAGRAEPGAKVTVTARSVGAASAERIVACGVTAAADGGWSCTAGRDLADGDQWLVVTATDLAGNGTAADAVTVRVVAAGAPAATTAPTSVVPSPVTPSPVVPTAEASAAVPVVTGAPAAPGVPSPAAPSPVGPGSPVPSPGTPAPGTPAPTAPASPVPSPSASPTPAAAPTGSPVPVPTVLPTTSVPPTPPVPSVPGPEAALEPVLPGLLPIVVPAVVDPVGRPAMPVATATTSVGVKPGQIPSPSPISGVSPSPSPTAGSSAAPSPSPSASLASPVSPGSPGFPSAPSSSPSTGAAAAPAAAPGAAQPVSAGQVSAEPSRALAAPPAGQSVETGTVAPPAGQSVEAGAAASQVASDRSRSDGWRGGLAGVLLLLTGVGLITRRVFSRGPGAPRR
ncbi:Ig-like domain-containing protein [Kitasatospora sp. NPDC056181]|uniref:Ig-like domain-containing protein n=1 Tax=Kitasatospora sp. NPDC056181 TaxID=3345737 RepID=UPI0035D6C974